MDGLVLADRVWVKFHGDRGGDGPMTLGQHNTSQWLGKLRSEHFLAMLEWIFEVPVTAAVDDVVAAWSVLISRHESLRTTYPPACGPDGWPSDNWPVQRVAVSGEVALDVYEVEDGAELNGTALNGTELNGTELNGTELDGAAAALIRVLRKRPFALDRDYPVRVGVVVGAGRIRTVAAVYSHLAVDYSGMAVLARQFAELVADPESRVVGSRAYQPLDQAEAERSDRGRKRAEAALRYWRDHIRRGPQCMFALPESALGAVPDDDGMPPTCGLRSPSGAMALPHITRRTEASPAEVLLAAFTAVLAHRTVSRNCMLVTLSNNRGEVRLRDYAGTLTQYGLILIDRGSTRFDDHVRHVATASLRAHRHSLFNASDLEAVHQAVNHSRGTWYDQDFVFNNLTTHAISPRSRELVPEAPEVSEMPASGAEGETEGRLGWWVPRWMPPALVQLDLLEVEPILRFGLISGDTRRVPRAELRLLLRGTERLLMAAAAGDVDLGQLTQITGVAPVTRDKGWLYLDSCWIDLSATQRLVAEALPGAAPQVFAVPGPDNTTAAGGPGQFSTVLTAYLAPTEAVRTPEQAHSACMRALPGRHTAMAPGRYVVCASIPADPMDLAGWQQQPVLFDGDGRHVH